MTARGIGVFTIEFPDPSKIDYVNNQFNTLNESISFQYRGVTNIQTLSTKGAASGSDPYGILYVPDVFTEACKRNESQYVPANASRIANLPSDRNYALIAFAPWYSAQCTIEYFTAARTLSATKAFLTYLPGNSNAQPPVLNNPAWDLQDGGSWQQGNTFPTYALSSMSGNNIMDQLNQYSGNISTVPNGDDLSKIFDSTSYVRLWATVSTDSSGTLPSLWVFLVIVLAILIAAIGTTSLCMHIIQRRRRNALRQRVLNGEVDLEALGVKRLTVSQAILDKMPIVTYTTGPSESEKSPKAPAAAANLAPGVDAETGSKTSPLVRRLSAPTSSTTNGATFSQPTCPICIDDFEPNETQVRELPCRHIFHPDCIDTFLLRNSSLCPMCKQSVLPAGACPVRITNMMVRRERHIARMSARSAWSAANGGAPPSVSVTVSDRARGAFGSVGRAIAGRRIFSAPERRQSPPADIEMGTAQQSAAPPPQPVSSVPLAPPPAPVPVPAPTNSQDCEPPPTPTQNRREWARQRALDLLGSRHAPPEVDSIEQEESARPKWKRALNKVFPGFR
ncbi:uncharacterized protein M421DRAFT_422874 [Didymella exigua CBS 183.55]|uniref:RING-type domain-containing protein n=1 Tax=Didymella exigua CBS 183.55 TaxID=1150837 RepID=A0A6A5RKY3_9PLEO|nr:uncharacterized protein M421DRAFT_422874 [Didymella exigua CBS 183.55]KAF1926197.1 hypothetical protein M421DRAFT_422874 [Didymella exigua CBS 183.55]